MKDASVFGIFGCIIPMQQVTVASESSQREKAQSSYVAKGQAQVMCNLYVANVPEGDMDDARHKDLLNNTLNILSSFNLLRTELLLGTAK